MRCRRWGSPLLAALALLPALAIETGAASAEQPYLWGLTSDNCMEKTDRQVQALRQFPQRVTIRTVFDLPENGGPQVDDYGACVKAFSAVADVMGLILDSQAMAALKPNDVAVRMAAYMARLGPDVRLWEVGNEVNGSWLGDDVLAKIEIMYDAAKAAHRLTALTLYHEVKPEPGTEMLGWVDAHIPPGHRLRDGLDYVLVSYYEDENGGHRLSQDELDPMFAALAQRFPNARLGIGEFGWGHGRPSDAAQRAALLKRVYQYRVPAVARFVGGGFYWHFRQTMVGDRAPDRDVLIGLMRGR